MLKPDIRWAGVITVATGEQPPQLADRLDHLFRTVHPPGRGPYTLREAAQGINTRAGRRIISANYLAYLRNGQRTRIGHDKLVAIADFFGVDISYFSDPHSTGRAEHHGDLLGALHDPHLRALILRAAGLSRETLSHALAILDRFRQLEGLPAIHDGTEPGNADPTD